MRFSEFDFDPDLLDGLDAMGFEEATPIQEEAIPKILNGMDLIACAQTGTGKTAAFLLPVLDKIMNDKNVGKVNTLIIVPTRELALQIDRQVEGLGYFCGVGSLPVYGGGDSQSWEQQKTALTQGADIIVATPGRLISHLNLGYVKLGDVKHLILDEADRMLDMGFFDDIMQIVDYLPKERQNLLFSATMPPKIRKLANKLLVNPEQINLALSKPAEGVLQAAYLVHEKHKIELITQLIEGKKAYPSILIFSSTKRNVKNITDALRRKKIMAEGISSDLEQNEREQVLLDFTTRKTQILVATDILARGIDIKNINLVINYDIPQDAEDYVHRIGRTARADSTGVAITFISDKDQYKFLRIEELIEMEIHKIQTPASIGESPVYAPKSSKQRKSYGGRKGSGGGKKRYGKKKR